MLLTMPSYTFPRDMPLLNGFHPFETAQDKLMSLMLGYQAAGFSLCAAGYALATAPATDDQEGSE